jgi:hypothetical protein
MTNNQPPTLWGRNQQVLVKVKEDWEKSRKWYLWHEAKDEYPELSEYFQEIAQSLDLQETPPRLGGCEAGLS